MKKLMVMLAAVAMAACAQAEQVATFITVYEKDTNPTNANVSWYSCYFMDLDAIKAATANSVTAVDITTYSTWLQANFASNVATTKSNASLVMTPINSFYQYQWKQYSFTYEATGFEQNKAFLAVCFFDNDTDHAFQIVKNTASNYKIDDSGKSNWTAAPSTEAIPEPTSGLMLLLGLAGLALKRKAV